MKKFFTITFIALIILFALGMYTKGKHYLYFYLSSSDTSYLQDSDNFEYASCDPKVAVLKTSLSYIDGLKPSLNWLLSYKTAKVSGLDNPFYASNLKAEVTTLDQLTIVNIIGDPLLASECHQQDFKVLIQKTVEKHVEGNFQIQLNGSTQAFADFGQLK